MSRKILCSLDAPYQEPVDVLFPADEILQVCLCLLQGFHRHILLASLDGWSELNNSSPPNLELLHLKGRRSLCATAFLRRPRFGIIRLWITWSGSGGHFGVSSFRRTLPGGLSQRSLARVPRRTNEKAAIRVECPRSVQKGRAGDSICTMRTLRVRSRSWIRRPGQSRFQTVAFDKAPRKAFEIVSSNHER